MLIHDDALGEAALKLITKTIYTEVLHVESTLGECCFACIREQAKVELIYKTRMALQVITGICEADAIELAEWIYKDENETRIDKCLADEIVKKNSELHTKTAKEFLENSFKSQEENNERS